MADTDRNSQLLAEVWTTASPETARNSQLLAEVWTTAAPETIRNSQLLVEVWISDTVPDPPDTVRSFIRRMRRFPLPFDRNLYVYLNEIEFVMEPGVGATDGAGENPLLSVRFSPDGGKTWGPTIRVEVGRLGEYLWRAVITQIGRVRNGVVEISCDAPVDWAFLEAYVDATLGNA